LGGGVMNVQLFFFYYYYFVIGCLLVVRSLVTQ
jgi:hypothetical protein